SVTLEGLPESPGVKSAIAALPAALQARIARLAKDEERAGELLSALADDALVTEELDELQDLVRAGAAPDLSFVYLSEAVAHAVRAPASDPAAARAGAAALQVLEAEALHSRATTTTTTAAPAAGPSLFERVRAGFGQWCGRSVFHHYLSSFTTRSLVRVNRSMRVRRNTL
ncbi:MAG: hypothetical protein KY410_06450, partial [Proteobacteria bacterium]|nr:hypothetical protein [Pseudomonadota bacterium]